MLPIVFPIAERLAKKQAEKLAIKLFFQPLRVKPRDEELELLASAKCKNIIIDDKQVAVYEWGKEGKIVLLTHGWAGRASQWVHFIDALQVAGFRVIAFDAPGHGNSEGTFSNIIKFEKCIKTINTLYGSIDYVIGHSLGGIANMLANKNGIQFEKMIKISSPSIAEDILDQFRKKINASSHIATSIESYVKTKYKISFDSVSGEVIASELPEKIPTLLIHDKEDQVVNVKHHIALKKKLPHADHFFTSGYGHARILSNQEVIDNCLAFILH